MGASYKQKAEAHTDTIFRKPVYSHGTPYSQSTTGSLLPIHSCKQLQTITKTTLQLALLV